MKIAEVWNLELTACEVVPCSRDFLYTWYYDWEFIFTTRIFQAAWINNCHPLLWWCNKGWWEERKYLFLIKFLAVIRTCFVFKMRNVWQKCLKWIPLNYPVRLLTFQWINVKIPPAVEVVNYSQLSFPNIGRFWNLILLMFFYSNMQTTLNKRYPTLNCIKIIKVAPTRWLTNITLIKNWKYGTIKRLVLLRHIFLIASFCFRLDRNNNNEYPVH